MNLTARRGKLPLSLGGNIMKVLELKDGNGNLILKKSLNVIGDNFAWVTPPSVIVNLASVSLTGTASQQANTADGEKRCDHQNGYVKHFRVCGKCGALISRR